jgi:Flp pilus assembly protein TadG
MRRVTLRPGTVRFRRLLADEAGVALVEFALVLPLLLVLLLGMIDVGKAVNYWNDETHLANEGARFAAVNKNPGPQPTLNQSIFNQADSDELKNGSTSISQPVSICIWFPNPVGHSATAATSHSIGDPVQVVVRAKYSWIAYIFGQGAQSTMRATSTMRLEQNYAADGTSDAYTTGTANNTNGTGTCPSN